MSFLAETLVSGEWITGLIVAVIGAVGSALVAYRKGAASVNETRLVPPVPEVPTRKVYHPPSWDQHQALTERVTRVEVSVDDLRKTVSGQYRELMVAASEREARLGEKLDGVARGIHERIDDLLLKHPRK